MPSRSLSRALVTLGFIVSVMLPLAAQQATDATQQTDYVLGSEDVFRITVWGNGGVSERFTVEADGTFTFPMLGRVKAGGLTVRRLQDELTNRLRDGYFNDPRVTVLVEEYRSQRIFLVGEIKNPGAYNLTRSMTLVEALALAGSTTSNSSGIAVVRRRSNGADGSKGPVIQPGVGVTEIRVDLTALQAGVLTNNPTLRDGDTIVVPRPAPVFVFGHVGRPGEYMIGKEATVRQVLSLAGGVSQRGAAGRIKIKRVADGTEQEIKVDLDDRVRPGDTIIVPERVLLMSEILQPPSAQESVTSRSEPRQWHFSDILPMLYRRRRVAITTFLVVAGAVAAYTFTATPIYEAHAELLLGEKPSIVTFEGSGTPAGDPKGYLETQQRILRSRSLARRVIDELALWNEPGFVSTGREASNGMFALLNGWRAKSQSPSPAKANSKEKIGETIAIDRMLSKLNVVPVRDTRIIEIRYESANPELAARIVNTLASTYIKQNIEARSQASKETSAWLADQLAEQRRKVETSELALQKYRERGNSLSLDAGQNIVVQRLNALNSAVTQAKTDRIAIESTYRQLAATHNNHETLDTFPQIRSNGLVQDIRSRLANLRRERMQFSSSLGAKHPEMVRLEAAINVAETELATEVAQDRGVGPSGVLRRSVKGERADGGARRPENERARAQSSGHRVRCVAPAGGERPSDLPEPSAARERDGGFEQPAGPQHRGRRRRGSATSARQAGYALEPPDRSLAERRSRSGDGVAVRGR